MSLSDFEVLLFKSVKKLSDDECRQVDEQIRTFMVSAGYSLAIFDNNITWIEEEIKAIINGLSNIKVTEEMVKSRQKKVLILQARNFKKDDEKLVMKILNDAFVDYEIDVLLISNKIKLEKSDTFFNRIARHLKIFNQVKKAKKDDFKKQLEDDKTED